MLTAVGTTATAETIIKAGNQRRPTAVITSPTAESTAKQKLQEHHRLAAAAGTLATAEKLAAEGRPTTSDQNFASLEASNVVFLQKLY